MKNNPAEKNGSSSRRVFLISKVLKFSIGLKASTDPDNIKNKGIWNRYTHALR